MRVIIEIENDKELEKIENILKAGHITVVKPKSEDPFDVTQDSIFQMEGYDSDAPVDLSTNIDKYLYGEEYPL